MPHEQQTYTLNALKASPFISRRWARWLLLLLCLPWALPAPAEDSGEYLHDAQAYINKGEVNAAIIQLKNALLADPANKEARLLLGQVYLKQKDGAVGGKGIAPCTGVRRGA